MELLKDIQTTIQFMEKEGQKPPVWHDGACARLLFSRMMEGLGMQVLGISESGYEEYRIEASRFGQIYVFESNFLMGSEDPFFANRYGYQLLSVERDGLKLEPNLYFSAKDAEERMSIYLNPIEEIKTQERIAHEQMLRAYALMKRDLSLYEGFRESSSPLSTLETLMEVPGLLSVSRMASNCYDVKFEGESSSLLLDFKQSPEGMERSWEESKRAIEAVRTKRFESPYGFNLYSVYERAKSLSEAPARFWMKTGGGFRFLVSNVVLGKAPYRQASVRLDYRPETDLFEIAAEYLHRTHKSSASPQEAIAFLDDVAALLA